MRNLSCNDLWQRRGIRLAAAAAQRCQWPEHEAAIAAFGGGTIGIGDARVFRASRQHLFQHEGDRTGHRAHRAKVGGVRREAVFGVPHCQNAKQVPGACAQRRQRDEGPAFQPCLLVGLEHLAGALAIPRDDVVVITQHRHERRVPLEWRAAEARMRERCTALVEDEEPHPLDAQCGRDDGLHPIGELAFVRGVADVARHRRDDGVRSPAAVRTSAR